MVNYFPSRKQKLSIRKQNQAEIKNKNLIAPKREHKLFTE